MPQLAMATVLPVFGRICATFHVHGRILTAAGDTVLSLVAVGQGCLNACSTAGGMQPEGASAPKQARGPVLSAVLGQAASCWLRFCIPGVSP